MYIKKSHTLLLYLYKISYLKLFSNIPSKIKFETYFISLNQHMVQKEFKIYISISCKLLSKRSRKLLCGENMTILFVKILHTRNKCSTIVDKEANDVRLILAWIKVCMIFLYLKYLYNTYK